MLRSQPVDQFKRPRALLKYLYLFYFQYELKDFPFNATIKLQYTGANVLCPSITVRDN